MTFGPGNTWATAQSSRNSSAVSQRFFSTISRCTIASTPPKPCKASQVKETKRSPMDRGCGRWGAAASVGAGCIAPDYGRRAAAPFADTPAPPMLRHSRHAAARTLRSLQAGAHVLEGRLRAEHGRGAGLLHGVLGGALAADRDLGRRP